MSDEEEKKVLTPGKLKETLDRVEGWGEEDISINYVEYVEGSEKPPVTPEELKERLDVTKLDQYPAELVERHRFRYNWVVERILARGEPALTALDFGCATGFGTKILLGGARLAVGVDIDSGAIRKAARYCNSGCAKFYCAGPNNFPDPRAEFSRKYDAIVCLEVIEHLRSPKDFLKRARRFSNSTNGLLLISTPERREGVSEDAKPDNEFHFKEYRSGDLRDLVEDSGWRVKTADREMLPGFILLEAVAK